MGLTLAEWTALSGAEKEAMRQTATARLNEGRPDFCVDTVAALAAAQEPQTQTLMPPGLAGVAGLARRSHPAAWSDAAALRARHGRRPGPDPRIPGG